MSITVGDRIRHISGVGDVWLVVLNRPECGDSIAVTEDIDPRITRVINEGNWKILPAPPDSCERGLIGKVKP